MFWASAARVAALLSALLWRARPVTASRRACTAERLPALPTTLAARLRHEGLTRSARRFSAGDDLGGLGQSRNVDEPSDACHCSAPVPILRTGALLSARASRRSQLDAKLGVDTSERSPAPTSFLRSHTRSDPRVTQPDFRPTAGASTNVYDTRHCAKRQLLLPLRATCVRWASTGKRFSRVTRSSTPPAHASPVGYAIRMGWSMARFRNFVASIVVVAVAACTDDTPPIVDGTDSGATDARASDARDASPEASANKDCIPSGGECDLSDYCCSRSCEFVIPPGGDETATVGRCD